VNVYLLTCRTFLSYDADWIAAFTHHFGGVALVRMTDNKPKGIDDAELVVLLHSTSALGVQYPDWLYRMANERTGKILMMCGNDYKHFEAKQQAADRLHVDLLATLAPNTPYTLGNGIRRIEHVPHALNPDRYRPTTAHGDRIYTVGFRGFRYPDNLGDTERNGIVEVFEGLPGTDIQWQILTGDAYVEWLGECQATCATEAGAPGMKAVSSRHFESIGSGTALVMYEGEFSGCLEPEHYVRLERDHSNMDEVLALIDDPAEWGKVVTRAYNHAVEHHTYDHRMRQIEDGLWRSPVTAH